MADYNIYIHSVQGDDNKTSPKSFKPNKTKPSSKDDDTNASFVVMAKQGFQTLAHPQSAIMGAIKGVAPILAVVMAAKIVDGVISTVEPFVTQESGDYRFNVEYNNIKKTFHGVMNPIGTTMNTLRNLQAVRLAEQRNEQARQLLGDSVINELGDKLL